MKPRPGQERKFQVWLEIAGNVAQIFIGAAFLLLLHIKLEERDVSNTPREETR